MYLAYYVSRAHIDSSTLRWNDNEKDSKQGQNMTVTHGKHGQNKSFNLKFTWWKKKGWLVAVCDWIDLIKYPP